MSDSAASKIIEAIARLQHAFHYAGLRDPVALVVSGEEQVRLLEYIFSTELMMVPNRKKPWEATTIRGMKVIHDLAP